MAFISEIAPDIFRISIFAQFHNLQFNHFLIKDDEPLLFHTGLRGMHAELRETVAKLIEISELRHISFSHFESDECGSRNEWLTTAPNADVICSQVGALEPLTAENLKKLTDLKPKTLAIMHGSSFRGDCAHALEDLDGELRELFGRTTS